jgi:hypothetical protein
MLGETKDEQAESGQTAEWTGADKLKQLLASRKFWAALIGLALVVLKSYQPDFPLNEEQVTNLVYVLVAYILGTAIEDNGRAAQHVGP